jgi:acetyl-CoA acetyltransferase
VTPRFGAAGKVAIVGYAHSQITRTEELGLGPLTLRTVTEAVADAGLTIDQIDGFTTGALFPSAGGRALTDGVEIVTADWVVAQLRAEPRWLCGFQGIGQICGSAILAANAVASGAADYVVMHRAMYNPPGRYHENPMTQADGAAQWAAPHGFWGPPVHMSLPYMEYMQRYGARREDMAELVVGAREAGAKIPWSHWYNKPLSFDDYMDARMLADPMSVLDCDIPINGVGAFVLTSAERAADLPHKPVYIQGYAQGAFRPENGLDAWSLDDMMEGGKEVVRKLWESSGMNRDEIDVPQIYDGFTPFLYFWLEAMGYCGIGEAHQYIKDPNISPGFPFKTGGGAVGNGRMHGVPQMLEAYLQLSQRAGDRQLEKAETAFACQAGPNIGGVVAYSAVPTI